MNQRHVINASVSPKGSLETLSQREVQQLSEASSGSTYTLFRQCALAILNTGARIDNAKTILEAYDDFEVRIHQQDRGVRLELLNRSEEHTYELQSLMRISYAVFCLKK